MLYVIHVWQHPPTNSCGRARHEWLFRLRFAQGRVEQLDLAPTLAVFASKSVISMPLRFAKDCSAHARLVIFVEMSPVRTSDAERDQGVSRKPSLHAIRDSRIASSPLDKHDSLGSRGSRAAPNASHYLRRTASAGSIDSTASPIIASGLLVYLISFPALRLLCSNSFRHSA
jgi:hypothetical protein